MWVKSPEFDRTLARLARALHNPALFRYLPIQCLPVGQIADDLEAALRQMFPERPFHWLSPVDVDNYAHLMQRLEAAESGIVFFSDFSAVLDAAGGLAAGLNQRRDRFAALPVSWICLLPTGAERLRQLQEQLPDFWAIRAGGTPELRYEWMEDGYGFFEREFPLAVPPNSSCDWKMGEIGRLEKLLLELPKNESELKINYLLQLILLYADLAHNSDALRLLDELEFSTELFLSPSQRFGVRLWRAEVLKNKLEFEGALEVLDTIKVTSEDAFQDYSQSYDSANLRRAILLKAGMFSRDVDLWVPVSTRRAQYRQQQILYERYLMKIGKSDGEFRFASAPYMEIMESLGGTSWFYRGLIHDHLRTYRYFTGKLIGKPAKGPDEETIINHFWIGISTVATPEDGEDIPFSMLNTGFISANLGWYTEPHWFAQRARQGILHFWGPAHPLVFETIKLDIYAEKVHFRWKFFFREKMMRERLRSAGDFFPKMLPLYEKGYGKGGFQSFQVRFYYGSYWLVTGRYEKAEAVLAALVADMEASGLHSPHLLALAWGDLGTARRLAWKTEAALAPHERAAAILAPLVGAAHPDRVFAEKNLDLTRAQLALPEWKRRAERWKGRLARLFGRNNGRFT